LHEHFVNPVVIKNGHYMPPQYPGYSATMYPDSLDEYEFPTGKAWTS
jgi:L-fuconate dehydratase